MVDIISYFFKWWQEGSEKLWGQFKVTQVVRSGLDLKSSSPRPTRSGFLLCLIASPWRPVPGLISCLWAHRRKILMHGAGSKGSNVLCQVSDVECNIYDAIWGMIFLSTVCGHFSSQISRKITPCYSFFLPQQSTPLSVFMRQSLMLQPQENAWLLSTSSHRKITESWVSLPNCHSRKIGVIFENALMHREFHCEITFQIRPYMWKECYLLL